MGVEEFSMDREASGEKMIEHMMEALASVTMALISGNLKQCWMLWDIKGDTAYRGAGMFVPDCERRSHFIEQLKIAIKEVEEQARKGAS